MVLPTIATPAAIPIFFIMSLLKNFALSGGISAGKGSDPSNVEWCDGANPSGIGCCKGTAGPPDIDSSEGIDPSGIRWGKGTDPPDIGSSEGIKPSDAIPWGRELVSVSAKSGPISCGAGCISDGPEVPELEG